MYTNKGSYTSGGRLAVVHVRAHRLVPQMSLQLPPVEAEGSERLELPRELSPKSAARLLDERVVFRAERRRRVQQSFPPFHDISRGRRRGLLVVRPRQ